MVVKKKERRNDLVVSFENQSLSNQHHPRTIHILAEFNFFFSLSHTTITMERPLSPPPRIQIISANEISTKVARKHLANFLDDFQARSTSAQGGNTAVTVQLQKLIDALKEESQRVKKRKDKKSNV